MNRLAVAIATVGGAGFVPIAPGTVGSAVGIGIYLATMHWPALWQVVLVVVVSLVGIAAADRAATALGRKDPGQVVVDEVAGQLLTLLLTGVDIWGALAGFMLFRVFDVAKPWPVRRFERLPGGVGIMADDLMAGVYGNLVLLIALRLLG
jgi:phosphatidylglycerophosphatase A